MASSVNPGHLGRVQYFMLTDNAAVNNHAHCIFDLLEEVCPEKMPERGKKLGQKTNACGFVIAQFSLSCSHV